MAAKCEEFYCRRGDRAPEKPEFFKLPTEDRQLICQLRSAINVAKDKVTVLRDESEDKERDLSREVALRRAAEQRLEQMVDMYGDPSVTEELRRRLPRAGKTDPKLRLQRDLEELDHASSLHSTGPDGSKARRNLAAELENQIITSETSRKSRSLSADSLSRRSQERDDRSRRNRSHSPPDRSRDRSRDYHHYPASPAGYPPGYPTGYPGGPYPGPYPGAAHPAFYPPMYTFPQQPVMYAATPGATPTPGGVPLAHSTPAHFYMMPAPTSSSTPAHSTAGQPVVVSPVQAQQAPPPQHGGQAAGGGVDSGVGVTSSVVGGATSVSDRSGVSNIKAVTINREQQRQISMILAELDASKDLNKKLQTKLTTSEKELGSLKLATQNQDATLNATKSDRIAELVEEIYRAQKTRDESMMGRLRVANEDRDEALLKLKRLRISSHQGLDSGKELLLGERTESWERLGEQLSGVGSDLVEKITSRRQRHTDISTEEMRAVLQERDSVVAKCRQLEAEVVKLQRLNRVRGSDKQQFSTLQAKLLATQQERDLALARVQKLEDELQTLRVYYSLHKSLSQEANLRDQFNNTLKNIEGAVKDRDSTIESSLQEKDQLLVQLKTVMVEKEALSEQLEKALAGQKEAQGNSHKLERLVNVLRRKINGLGSKMDDCC